jgi:ABC-type antimicrobial peptide transport system permease subunit
MARKFWPNQNPVGQTILIGAQLGPALEQGPTEIVGVVGDVHTKLESAASPTMYQLHSQVSDAAMKLVNEQLPAGIIVRTTPGVAPMTMSKSVQNALLAGNTELLATDVQPMEQLSLHSTARQNFSAPLLSLFAAIALLLTAAGIYGVMSYSVARRTQEIGIRAALGAGRLDIFSLVLRQASWVTLSGLVVGVIASFGLSRLLSAQLFGVTAFDPLTFITVPLILLAVAMLAAWMPARRAARVDPMVALRYE